MTQNVVLHQIFQTFFRVRQTAEALAIPEGQLVSGAFQMGKQNVEVVRLHQRVFRGGTEEIVRMLNDILIQRRGGSYQNGDSRILAPAGAPGLLPGAGN